MDKQLCSHFEYEDRSDRYTADRAIFLSNQSSKLHRHWSYTRRGNGNFVAKKEVESWFLAGRICRDMGTIFIDRSNRRDIPRAGEKIIERLEHGEGVIVFPKVPALRATKY